MLLLVRDGIICSEQPQFHTNCEILWVKLELKGRKPLYVASYYKPKENDKVSSEELSQSLAMVNSKVKGSQIWVLGDFNYPGLTWPNSTPIIKHDCQYKTLYDDFLTMIDDNSLVQMVDITTRGENTLDLFLTNNPTFVSKVTTIPGVSDHDIVSVEVQLKPQVYRQVPRKVPLFRKADWDGFKQHLTTFYSKFIRECKGKSVNDLWTDFRSTMESGIQKFVPIKTFGTKRSLPWVTQEIKRYIRRRDSLYQKQKGTKKAKDRSDFIKAKHKVNASLKMAYNIYIEGLLGLEDVTTTVTSSDNQSKYSPKRLFSFLKACRQDAQGVAPLKKDGLLHTNNEVKATILNNQFQSVFSARSPLKLSQLCQLNPGSSQDNQGGGGTCRCGTMHHSATSTTGCDQRPNQGKCTMHDITISTAGIDKLLQNLHPDKAAGPDELKPLLYKELHAEIAPILQVIFSTSLSTGTVPDDWTKARVTPIFKKGDKSSAANYRPISLTCIACKIQEHIVTSHLVKFLNIHNILYDLQHGFREKRSCETQLVMLIEDLSRNLQSGKQTDVILLDFSKAFDKVNHLKLLYKLHQYGVRGQTLRWIQAFLGNRQQTVVVDGEESPPAPVTSGVPQGSVLGPILFLIYINDLPEQVRSKVRLFADDTALYLTLNNLTDSKTIQEDLDRLTQWELDWDMEFNPSKCQVIQVTRSRQPIPTQYHLQGHTLEVVDHAKYLGVNISSDLKWNTHVNYVVNKSNRSLGLIKRNIKTKHQNSRSTCYKTIVRPQLEYAASAPGPPHQRHVRQT